MKKITNRESEFTKISRAELKRLEVGDDINILDENDKKKVWKVQITQFKRLQIGNSPP